VNLLPCGEAGKLDLLEEQLDLALHILPIPDQNVQSIFRPNRAGSVQGERI
jgi:hypothetical protein